MFYLFAGPAGTYFVVKIASNHKIIKMKHHTLASVAILLLALTYTVSAKDKYSDKEKYSDKNKIVIKEKDMLRKSIVFDKKTPDVFYCPMQKPSGLNKLIVR